MIIVSPILHVYIIFLYDSWEMIRDVAAGHVPRKRAEVRGRVSNVVNSFHGVKDRNTCTDCTDSTPAANHSTCIYKFISILFEFCFLIPRIVMCLMFLYMQPFL